MDEMKLTPIRMNITGMVEGTNHKKSLFERPENFSGDDLHNEAFFFGFSVISDDLRWSQMERGSRKTKTFEHQGFGFRSFPFV